MNNYGIVPEPNTVRFERVLPGPIGRVWEYLTDAEKRSSWFAGGPMELRVGGRAELHFDHTLITEEPTPEKYRKMMEDANISVGHITQLDPPRLLAYTWWEDSNDRSEIIFELSEQGSDVLLVLTHRRLADRAEMLNVSGGWHLHLDILEDRLNGVKTRPFWSLLTELEAEYEKRYAAMGHLP